MPVKKTGENRKGNPNLGPGPGRPKGVPNKTTTALREQILGALAAKDGQKWFEARMEDQPAAFMTLLGKILPSEMTATLQNPGGGPLTITIQLRKPNA